MRLNPVFEKEMKRNSRSSRISWIIFVCNLLLAVVAFVCYFGESSQLGYLAPVSYSVPMNCYILMTYLLFILVVLRFRRLREEAFRWSVRKKRWMCC